MKVVPTILLCLAAVVPGRSVDTPSETPRSLLASTGSPSHSDYPFSESPVTFEDYFSSTDPPAFSVYGEDFCDEADHQIRNKLYETFGRENCSRKSIEVPSIGLGSYVPAYTVNCTLTLDGLLIAQASFAAVNTRRPEHTVADLCVYDLDSFVPTYLEMSYASFDEDGSFIASSWMTPIQFQSKSCNDCVDNFDSFFNSIYRKRAEYEANRPQIEEPGPAESPQIEDIGPTTSPTALCGGLDACTDCLRNEACAWRMDGNSVSCVGASECDGFGTGTCTKATEVTGRKGKACKKLTKQEKKADKKTDKKGF